MRGDAKKRRRQAQAANAGRRKRRRAGKRTLHHILLTLFFFGAGLILCLTVFFKIETVSVTGTDKYDPLELAAASGVALGDNMFRISEAAVKENLIGPYAYIESVEVNRKIPSTIEIVVTQSVPSGAVKEGDDYVLITSGGKVLERGTLYIPEDIPVIKGLDTLGVEPGQYLGMWDKHPASEDETEEMQEARLKLNAASAEHGKSVKDSLIMLDYLYKAMEESGFSSITNVDISDRLNMVISYENRLLLKLGTESDLSYKLELIRDTIRRLPDDARGSLDASRATQKRWVVFSPDISYEPEQEPDQQEERETDDSNAGFDEA